MELNLHKHLFDLGPGPSECQSEGCACLRHGELSRPETQSSLCRSSWEHSHVLYKMGICSVESLYLLRTPMSSGLPLLQRKKASLAVL